jgi:hypothetical protein
MHHNQSEASEENCLKRFCHPSGKRSAGVKFLTAPSEDGKFYQRVSWTGKWRLKLVKKNFIKNLKAAETFMWLMRIKALNVEERESFIFTSPARASLTARGEGREPTNRSDAISLSMNII